MCTLFPTVMVSKCVPSSFETQSNMTVCLGAIADGAFPISLMYFLTPSKVDRLGTDVRPKMKPEIVIQLYELITAESCNRLKASIPCKKLLVDKFQRFKTFIVYKYLIT